MSGKLPHVEGTETAAPASQSSDAVLVIDDDGNDGNAVGFGDSQAGVDHGQLRLADISQHLLDDSTSASVVERITNLEVIADQQTQYFIEWTKMGGAVSTLAGHVALLARAFCVMEKRYGVTPENSMGEYLFRKMEGSIPDEMRQAAEDAGFNMSVDETPQKLTQTVKRRAPLSPQQTPAKVAKKDTYKPFSFELNGKVYVSKEQPHIKTDGNMCVSYVEDMAGCMLFVVAEGQVPEFPPTVIDAAQKLSSKAAAVQKGNEEQQADRLSMFVQHLLKLFIGTKMKLPVIVCANLNPDAPRESLKAFAAAQGALGGQLMKLGATSTGLVGGDKKLSADDKVAIVNVMQKSVVHLKQVLDHWASGTGRFDVERYPSENAGTSTSSAIDVFDDN